MEGCGEEQEKGLEVLAAMLEDIGNVRKSSLVSSLSEEASTSEDEEEESEEQRAWEQDRKKLMELEEASQALLAELSVLEAECQVERSCREQAEVYAAQVSQENKELKRLSVLLPSLDSEPLHIKPQEEGPPSEPSLSPEQQHIRDLGAQVAELLQEKKELTLQVQELRRQLREQEEKIQKEQLERTSLQMSMGQSQRALAKLKRVSHLVLQECGEAWQQLHLEQDLRQQAEIFAHKMLVEKKEAHRQSAILLQNHGPSTQLSAALAEVATLSRALEEAKRQHREQVVSWEASQEEVGCLKKQLKELEEKISQLEALVCTLEERVKRAETPTQGPEDLPPAPPPPPPPLPPSPAPAADPLQVIRLRRGLNSQPALEAPSLEDKKAKAVQEMMDRIRQGVVLRPATRQKDPSQDLSKRRSAAITELQTMLASKCQPLHRGSRRKRSSRKGADGQLMAILQRRRHVVDSTSAGPQDGTGEGHKGIHRAEAQGAKSQGLCEDWRSGNRIVQGGKAGADPRYLPRVGKMTLVSELRSHQGTEHYFSKETQECPPEPAEADRASVPQAKVNLRTPALSKASVLWGQPKDL
ncbi:shootin-1-like [Dromiciops gliroides]|uniref:shootin-1-like n=1 Tax=Dromiciops gliroides TaxID=33562 RepID=UPI001CC6918A|nr:shootin-1-like [Dromiciops gliroides]